MGDQVYKPKRRRRKITNQSYNRDNNSTNDNDWEVCFARPSVNGQQPQQATVTPKLTSPTTTLSRVQRDENWNTKNSEQDCTGKTQSYSLMNEINANGGKSIDDKHHDDEARMLNQKMPPDSKINRWDSPLCPKKSIQPPHDRQRDPLQSPIKTSNTVIGAPTKPDDDTPLTEILRAAGGGDNHLVQSSRVPMKSIMKKEEIDYNMLGTFDFMIFKGIFNLNYGTTQKIVEAVKQYDNSKQKKFRTSPGESDKKMPAVDHSTNTVAMNKPNVPPPDHSTTTVATNDQSVLRNEIQQLRELMTKMVSDTKDTSQPWMTGEGTYVRVRKLKNNCTTTISKYVKLMNWYDNNLADGVTWKQEQPDTICKKILEHFTKYDKLQERFEESTSKGKTLKGTTTTMSTTTTVLGYKDPSTKRSYLQSFFSILNTEDRMDQLHVQAKKLVVDKKSIYSSEETKLRANGIETGNIILTNKDLLHILNCVLEEYDGQIPTHELEILAKLVNTNSIGRRTSEMYSTSAASWRYDVVSDPDVIDSKKVRRLYYQFHKKKGTESGTFSQYISEEENSDAINDPIVTNLILMERKGMIPEGDALKIYRGEKTWENIDPAIFETSDDLMTKIKNATLIVKANQTKTGGFDLDADDNIDDDDDDDDDEEYENENENENDKKSCDTLFQQLRQSDAANGCTKIPMYTNTRPRTGQVTSIRCDPNNTRELREFCASKGYTPSRKQRISFVGGRRKFRRETIESTKDIGMNNVTHANAHLSHDTGTGAKYYQNDDAYRAKSASNQFCHGVSNDHAMILAKASLESGIEPAYTRPSFFDVSFPIRDSPLTDKEEFIKTHTGKKYNTPINRAATPSLWTCLSKGCNHKAYLPGDLTKHMLDKHGEKGSGKFECSCSDAITTWNNFPYFQKHVVSISCTSCDDGPEKRIIKGQFNKRKPIRASRLVVTKKPLSVGRVKESLMVKNPVTGEQQEYHYEKETLVNGKKTLFYCCETGCTRNFSRRDSYKRHVISCQKMQADEKKKSASSTKRKRKKSTSAREEENNVPNFDNDDLKDWDDESNDDGHDGDDGEMDGNVDDDDDDDDNIHLSDYDKLRLAKMKRNNERLVSLGFPEGTGVLGGSSQKNKTKKKKKKTAEPNVRSRNPIPRFKKKKLIIQKNRSLMTLPGYGDQPVWPTRLPHDQSVTKTPHGKMSERRFHFKQAVGTINNSFVLDYNIFDGMA